VVSTEDGVFILDNNLHVVRSFPNTYHIDYLDPQNCNLIGLFFNSVIHIELINFRGQEIQSEEIKISEPQLDKAYQLTISPDQNWLAYKVISGEFGMAYEYAKIQNVRVINRASVVDPKNWTDPIGVG
jgi:hypothetical protein